MDRKAEKNVFSEDERRDRPGPCTGIVVTFFGFLFLIVLLSVPVTTTSSRLRQDQGSHIVVRTTYPQNARMFLPRYIAMKADAGKSPDIRLRAAEWIGTMIVVAVLGVFDCFVVCRLLRRTRRPDREPEPG